jgi:hypothetical protein
MTGKAIEAKRWRHISGRTASVYGACPWTSEADEPNWRIESAGWTVQHPDGTTGIGRVPFATKEEADAWIAAHPRFPGMRHD